MGSVLENLDRLVVQPTGCGEQNMIKLAPIASVLKYLNRTEQLTSEIKEKALTYLKLGKIYFIRFRFLIDFI